MTDPIEQEEAVDAREMARRLGVSRATVYILAKQERIPALKVGGAWRFRPSVVIAHLETGRRERPEPEANPWAQPARSHIMQRYYAEKRGETFP